MSGVGRCRSGKRSGVRAMVDATTAEAQSVRTQVESRIATLAAAAETGTARMAAELGSQIQKVAEYTDAQTCCASLWMYPSDWKRRLMRL